MKAGEAGTVRVLGAWRLPDRTLLGVRMGGVDVVIDLRPEGSSDEPVFQSMRGADARLFRHPAGDPASPGENLALRWLVERFLDREPLRGVREVPPGHTMPEDVPLLLAPPKGLVVVQVRRLEGALEASVTGPEPGATGLVRWSRSDLAPAFMGISVEGRADGRWDAAAADALDSWAAGVAAALPALLGPDARWSAAASPRTLYVTLGRPIPREIADLQGEPPSRLAVHVIVPSRCLQACGFCAGGAGKDEPRVAPGLLASRADHLGDRLAEVVRGGVPVDLVLVGDDALNVPDPVGLIGRLLRCRPGHVRIVTPGTLLAQPALARSLADLDPRPALTLSLLGPDAGTHDRLVGRQGAFAELEASLVNCHDAGLDVLLNLVIVGDNADLLDLTVARAEAFRVPSRLVLYRSEPAHTRDFLLANLPPLDLVAAALARLPAGLEHAVAEVVDVPLCVLPPSLRGRATFSEASLPDPADQAPAACAACPAAGIRCPGPTRGYLRLLGERGLRTLGR